jgi:hypothetical protein
MRSRLSAMEEARRDLEGRARTLGRELSQARARADGLGSLTQNNGLPKASPTPLIASLVLIAGPSRAESRTEQIVLGGGTQIAHIEIQLEPRDDYPRFRAEVTPAAAKKSCPLATSSAQPAAHRAFRWTCRPAPCPLEDTKSR